jgi:predicted nuclease of restriction endonuclease-like RecB superfamily|tara:strand:+ start:10977 stop:11501 length:525 start_codon:yes stop_codon:yes gene_type:complete
MTKFVQNEHSETMMSLRTLPAALVLGLAMTACQSAEKKAENDQAKVVSDVAVVCSASADVETALKNVDELTPASTVADAETAGNSLKEALSKLDRAEKQLIKSEVKEYRDQVAIYKDFIAQVRKNKTMTLEEASQQIKTMARPLVAAQKQLLEETVCVDIDSTTDPKEVSQSSS